MTDSSSIAPATDKAFAIAATNYRAASAILKGLQARLEEAADLAEKGDQINVTNTLTFAFDRQAMDAIQIKQAGDKAIENKHLMQSQ